jgi:hypothetical protein
MLRDRLRLGMKGAIADHVMGARHGQVRARRKIHINAQIDQLTTQKLVVQRHRLKRQLGFAIVKRTKTAAPAAQRARCGGLQALHTTAFLVDEDRRLAPHRVAQRIHEPTHLFGAYRYCGRIE